jgi:hypothetical protein
VNAQALQGVTPQEAERLFDTLAQLITHLETDPITSKIDEREEA